MLKHQDIDPKDTINSILRKVIKKYKKKQGKRLCVYFALYCAESVFEFSTKVSAEIDINIVRKWLNNQKSILNPIFINNDNRKAYYANVVARNAAYVTNLNNSSAIANTIDNIAFYAESASYQLYSSIAKRYKRFANNLLSDHDIVSSVGKAGIKDETDLAVFFDEIEDSGLLINKNNKISLNLPGVHIEGDDNGDLARKIFADYQSRVFVVNWLDAKFT